MNTTNPLLPPLVSDDDIVAVWHYKHGLHFARSRRDMSNMEMRAIMRPSTGWHRILRPFLCQGMFIFNPRVKYSPEEIKRFEDQCSMSDL
jgi:hypothetical protein